MINMMDNDRGASAGKNDKPKKKLTENDIIKYEIAEELGLMDKVRESGWKSLTAKESGRIGGLMAKRKKDAANRSAKGINI